MHQILFQYHHNNTKNNRKTKKSKAKKAKVVVVEKGVKETIGAVVKKICKVNSQVEVKATHHLMNVISKMQIKLTIVYKHTITQTMLSIMIKMMHNILKLIVLPKTITTIMYSRKCQDNN